MRNGKRKSQWVGGQKIFYSQKLYEKQLLETLETRDENENGLYVIQKTNIHTSPAQWGFNIRQSN
jgi:hypothetical protein